MKCVLWLGLVACQVSATDIKQEGEALRRLTNEELILEYQGAGTELDSFFPTDGVRHMPMIPPPPRLDSARAEIARRGRAIVPELIGFLEQEVPRSRPRHPDGLQLSFTSDVLGMLVESGDERAAPVTLRILEGFGGQAERDERRAALDAIRRLTHVCFSTIDPSSGYGVVAVQDPDARPVEIGAESLEEAAELYRRWLEGEGKDASQWLAIARARARSQLASEDIDRIWCAAEFLRHSPEHDDDPDATLARIMHVLGKMKRVSEGRPYDHEYEGVLAEMPLGSWFRMAAGFGPRARPYSSTLIRLHREMGDTAWGGFDWLRCVGGNEILAYLVERLPTIGAEVAKIDSDPARPEGFRGGDPRLDWILSLRGVQLGIDRWAGRVFESDADRIAWWESNKSKTSEQQLRPNLAILMKQADESTTDVAASLAREILPELPQEGAGPFRQAWFEQHRAALVYDENAGEFRVE